MNRTTVFVARKIHTMNQSEPVATHVAVRDGRILAVGGAEEMTAWGNFVLDDRFAKYVLTPGFIEGHAHAQEGSIWEHPYVGYHDRYDPEGNLWRGAVSFDAVVETLQEIASSMGDESKPLFAWGFDPIYFGEQRMTTAHLDKVSATRPIVVMHSNGHLINVNSRVLEMTGISSSTDAFGITKDTAGNPTGSWWRWRRCIWRSGIQAIHSLTRSMSRNLSDMPKQQ